MQCQGLGGWLEQSQGSRGSILDQTESWQPDGDLDNLTQMKARAHNLLR